MAAQGRYTASASNLYFESNRKTLEISISRACDDCLKSCSASESFALHDYCDDSKSMHLMNGSWTRRSFHSRIECCCFLKTSLSVERLPSASSCRGSSFVYCSCFHSAESLGLPAVLLQLQARQWQCRLAALRNLPLDQLGWLMVPTGETPEQEARPAPSS